jgi:mRNA interferase HigB
MLGWRLLEGLMRIISVGTLRDFWTRSGRRDAEEPLRAWVHIVRAARWSKPTDIKQMFRSVDILQNGRAIFDIGGNKYRLICSIHYRGERVYVRFIGTHQEYDKVDAASM